MKNIDFLNELFILEVMKLTQSTIYKFFKNNQIIKFFYKVIFVIIL
jgi:hypothetical protein